MGAGFQFLTPEEGAAELASFIADAPLPLLYQELGYSSAPANGGSLEAQADFFASAFTTMFDAALAVNVNWYCEQPQAECEALAQNLYELTPDDPDYEAFIGFLCSLGMIEGDGAPKPAWEVFATALAAEPGA